MQPIIFAILINSVHFSFGCGRFEFYSWQDLPSEVKVASKHVGYDSESWDLLGKISIEDFNFSELKPDDDIINALETLDLIGVDGNCWDHFVNHYKAFAWDELRGKTDNFGDSIQEALIELGWEQPMWDERVDQIPKSECMGWAELSADKQWAIGVLGYTELKWDAYPTDPRCIVDDST